MGPNLEELRKEPNEFKVSSHTQTVSSRKSIEVQTSSPVDIIFEPEELPIGKHYTESPLHSDNLYYDMVESNVPQYVEIDERLSPGELVEKLLSSLQVYEKVFESDVRLTRLLASASNNYENYE